MSVRLETLYSVPVLMVKELFYLDMIINYIIVLKGFYNIASSLADPDLKGLDVDEQIKAPKERKKLSREILTFNSEEKEKLLCFLPSG